jgi:phytoene dehydrogenase-like protein
MSEYDAIVVGAGHNGLIAAGYLARAGWRVLVLERREVVGGACVTEEVWPGYRLSTAAYLCSLLRPEIVRDLEMERCGFQVYRRETAGFAPFPEGAPLFLYPDAAQTRASLARFCRETPSDVEAYFRFEADVERAAAIVEPFLMRDPPSAAELEAAFAAQGDAALYDAFVAGSVRALLDARFQNAGLKAMLATDGLIGTYAGPSTPGTAYVLLHHYLGRVLGARGAWGYVRGGMGQITQALAQYVQEHGGVIRTSAPVARLEFASPPGAGSFRSRPLECGGSPPLSLRRLAAVGGDAFRRQAAPKAKREQAPALQRGAVEPPTGKRKDPAPGERSPVIGVLLQSGEEIRAPVVLSNADPYHTFSCLIDPALLQEVVPGKPAWTALVTQGGASAKINLAVSELPQFACLPGASARADAGPEHLGTVHISPSLDYLERAWEEARQGVPSTEPMIEMYLQTATDSSLTPPGRHILSLFVQYFPYNLASGLDLESEREAFADRVIRIIAHYAPNVPGSILHRQVLTPRDLEARFGLTGGHIFHGDLLPPHLWNARPQPGFVGSRTPFPGLYLCGSGAHPGGCVFGAPGYNAAQAVLKDGAKTLL